MDSVDLLHVERPVFRPQMLVPLQDTRFIAMPHDPPYLPPPYSSLMDKVRQQNMLYMRQDEIRQIAEHPMEARAGQASAINGELGRFAAPGFNIPEINGGDILATSI